MGIKDLIGDTPYPASPGYKEATTSKDAAKAISGRAATLRDKVFAAICAGPVTADEVAERLGETVLAIRPRLSELRKAGWIEPSGERRKNASGVSAHVWKPR